MVETKKSHRRCVSARAWRCAFIGCSWTCCYLKTDPTITYDWSAVPHRALTLPVGIDIGKVMKIGGQDVSLQIRCAQEPDRLSAMDHSHTDHIAVPSLNHAWRESSPVAPFAQTSNLNSRVRTSCAENIVRISGSRGAAVTAESWIMSFIVNGKARISATTE